MGDLSEHFSRWEFACSDACGANMPNGYLVDCLEDLRGQLNDYFQWHIDNEIKIHVNSGCRCDKRQREIYRAMGRVPNWGSQHLRKQGYKAADIYAFYGNGNKKMIIDSRKLAQFASQVPGFDQGGIGCYTWGIHVDVRGYTARWGLGWRGIL